MDPREDDREVCGTCYWNRYYWRESDYICNCEDSECYGCPTEYLEHCEEWSRK